MDTSRDTVVVVGIDGSKDGARALQWAERYTALTGSLLVIVYAWQRLVVHGSLASSWTCDDESQARELLEKARADVFLPDDRVVCRLVEGRPGEVLEHASAEASLLVVGTRGLNPVLSILLGSTSAYCSRHADVPVVVVR